MGEFGKNSRFLVVYNIREEQKGCADRLIANLGDGFDQLIKIGRVLTPNKPAS